MDILTASEKVTISRKKLYCLARMFQSLENTESPFAGCAWCKISNNGGQCPYSYEDMLRWLRTLTGINVSIVGPEDKQLNKEVPIGETIYY